MRKSILFILFSLFALVANADKANTHYPRKIVMEEATGTWCGWCVRGIETIERMSLEYPDNFIGIGLHSGDAMANPVNYNPITSLFKAYPNCIFNRNSNGAVSVDYYSAKRVVEQYKNDAIAKISSKAVFANSEKSQVKVSTESTFGFSENGASYRIAYVVLEDKVGPYMQNNAYAGNSSYDNPSNYMYNWVQKSSPTEVLFNDVARGIFGSADGVDGSVPQNLTEGVAYSFDYVFTLPTNITNKENIRIVVMLLDSNTGEILNADQSAVTTDENVNATTFSFYYGGAKLSDGSVVTINAKEDEFGTGEMTCDTNPATDPKNGLILTTQNGSYQTGTATIEITNNTLAPNRIQWCMGGECVLMTDKTYLEKDFQTDNTGVALVQFDAAGFQSSGTLVAKLTAKIGNETHVVNINFIYTKSNPLDVKDQCVDLGLSVKWASWNVGAKSPEELGELYAWGELAPKTNYSSSTYKFYNNTYTKYGSIDNKYRLDPEDDVAQQLWGDKWRMPTFEELKELKEKCTFTKTELNGVPVTKVEGPNGNFIYFPYPGNYTGTTLYYKNSIGSYWSSDLESDSYAKDMDFENGAVYLNGDTRYHGQSVRPVYGENSDNPQSNNFGTIADVVDMGLSVKWASWNIGASKIADYGGLYGAGDPTGLKTSTEYSDYYFKNGESICGTEYDLAHVKWGGYWRMPTWNELEELKTKCSWTDGELDGVKGSWVKGPNGNSIFLPWAGNRKGTSTFSDKGVKGYYWSGDMGVSLHSYGYKDLDIKSGGVFQTDGAENYWGQSIRPVYVGDVNSEISIVTKIFDANSQPPIVGGMIDGYSDGSVLMKGIIVSTNADNLKYDASQEVSSPRFYEDKTKSEAANNRYSNKNYRIIDCTGIGKEQFGCTLKLLEGNSKYFIKAFAIQKDGAIIYGETLEIVTKSYSRYNDSFDRANVWHAFDSTLFDLVTDEIINPNEGFYYSTNENPTVVRHQVGTGYNTCYKFLTEWNYKLWYYHSAHCNQDKIVNTPTMTFSDNKLFIEKNPLDNDKDITIYYSINGNYFRPENYTDVYNSPISITEPCAIYCYAISSDGYISYTNMYVVGDYQISNSDPVVTDDDRLEVGNVIVTKGNTVSIDINLTNRSTDLTAYQFDLVLPAGVTLATNSNGKYQVTKTSRYDDDNQTLNISKVEGSNNTYRIVCFSMSNDKITGTSGAILNAVLAIDANIADGTYEAKIMNIIFTKRDGSQEKLNDAKFNIIVNSVIPGDANGDSEVNVSDIVEIVNYIMGKPSAKFVEAGADMNGDGEVNVTDIVKVVSIIMSTNNARQRASVVESTDNDRLTLAENENNALSLCLNNESGYVASQFDIHLSAGQTLEGIMLNSIRSKDHVLTYTKTNNDTYRVVVYSLGNLAYTGNNGELLSIQVSGTGSVDIDNILFVTTGQNEKLFASLHSYTTGINAVKDIKDMDIYSVDGRLVRKQVNNTNDLKKGIYIINGKKQVVR